MALSFHESIECRNICAAKNWFLGSREAFFNQEVRLLRPQVEILASTEAERLSRYCIAHFLNVEEGVLARAAEGWH